MPNACYCGWY